VNSSFLNGNFLVGINSFTLIFLILNQNDNTKEFLLKKTKLTNPLEKFTWILLTLEFILFLIKIKS
jgi:hypothetical protein